MGKIKFSKADLQLIANFAANMPSYAKRYVSGPKAGEFMMALNKKNEEYHIMTDPIDYMTKIARDKGVDQLPVYYRKYLDEYNIVSELLTKKACEKAGVKYTPKSDDSIQAEPE